MSTTVAAAVVPIAAAEDGNSAQNTIASGGVDRIDDTTNNANADVGQQSNSASSGPAQPEPTEKVNSTQVLPSASKSFKGVERQEQRQSSSPPRNYNADYDVDIDIDDPDYCPKVFVRSLFWNYTKKGETSYQKCPGGASGLVRWQCVYNPESGLSEWFPVRPNFSECRSLWLDILEERLSKDDSVVRIANDVATMTLTKALFADDLRRISMLVQRSLNYMTRIMKDWHSVEVYARHQVLKEHLNFIVEIISNILGNPQDDAWLDLPVSMRKNVASSMMKSLESSALMLAENANHDGSTAIAKSNVCKYLVLIIVAMFVLINGLSPQWSPFTCSTQTCRSACSFPPTRTPSERPNGCTWTTRSSCRRNPWWNMPTTVRFGLCLLCFEIPNTCVYLADLAKVAFFAFYRIEDLLKTNNAVDVDRYNGFAGGAFAAAAAAAAATNTSQPLTINSRVIGASISRNGEAQHYNLAQPVMIVLRHIQEENITSSKCVYWNMLEQQWLSDGCWVEASNATHTTCMCNHLTHFALLSEFNNSPAGAAGKFNWKFESIVVLASCLIAALVLTFLTILVVLTPSGNTISTAIHRHLCATMLATEATYLLQIYGLDNKLASLASLTCLHYFFLSTFCWTFFESFDIYMNVNSIYENFKSSRRLCWYYILAYFCPLLLVLLCYNIDHISYSNFEETIFRTDSYLYILFIGPAIALVLGAIVFILFASFFSRNHTVTTTTIKCFEDFRVGCSKSLIRWVLCLVVVQFVNWTLAFTYITTLDSLLLALLFAVANLLATFYILVFCIMKIENIQHSCLFRYLPFAFCQDDSQLSSAKNSTTSDVYSTRPVVTQVTSTQVNDITLASSSLAHSPSTPTATSPVSMSPCLPPQSLPIVRYTTFCPSGIASTARMCRCMFTVRACPSLSLTLATEVLFTFACLLACLYFAH